jgi:hypothetical protein
MLFALICTDKPDSQPVRLANRAAHLEFLQSLGGAVKAGGPFLDDTGEGMNGSLLVIEADDATAIEAIAARDPYAQAGLFASVDIRPWKWAVNNPEN